MCWFCRIYGKDVRTFSFLSMFVFLSIDGVVSKKSWSDLVLYLKVGSVSIVQG